MTKFQNIIENFSSLKIHIFSFHIRTSANSCKKVEPLSLYALNLF